MGRDHLAGRTGDATNAVLAATGYNFRLLITWPAVASLLPLATIRPEPCEVRRGPQLE
jgi:transposase, IS5 family